MGKLDFFERSKPLSNHMRIARKIVSTAVFAWALSVTCLVHGEAVPLPPFGEVQQVVESYFQALGIRVGRRLSSVGMEPSRSYGLATIGYEGATVESFLETLRRAGIEY